MDCENICKLYECVKSVESLQVLPHSELWEVEFKNQTKGWMRIFPALEFISRFVGHTETVIDKTLTQYYNEYRIYYNIIRPLLSYQACPHFFKPLGAGVNCPATSLLQYFGGNPKIASQKQRLLNVIQEMTDSVFFDERRSLIPSGDEKEKIHPSITENPINTLVLQQPSRQERPVQFSWDLLFQVAIACYALELSKVNHNMLDSRTIKVYDAEHSKRFYLIKNHCYQQETPHDVFVHWFQAATSPQLSPKQRFQPLKDLVMFCHSIVQAQVSFDDKEKFARELATLLVNAKGTDDPYTIDDYNQVSLTGGAEDDDDFDSFLDSFPSEPGDTTAEADLDDFLNFVNSIPSAPVAAPVAVPVAAPEVPVVPEVAAPEVVPSAVPDSTTAPGFKHVRGAAGSTTALPEDVLAKIFVKKRELKKPKPKKKPAPVKKRINKQKEMMQQLMYDITIKPHAWELLLDYNFLNKLEDIIYLLSLKCKKCKLLENLIPENETVYTLSPNMFEHNGQLKLYENNMFAKSVYDFSIPNVRELDKVIEKRQREINELKIQLAL